MEFNTLVLNRLSLIFQNYNLSIKEQSKNYVRLNSSNVVITIVRDERENINLLYVGKNEDNQFLIDGNIIKKIFIHDLERFFIIPEITIQDFVNNLVLFFEGAGQKLLNGDSSILKAIEEYVHKESKQYTLLLLEKQNLEVADRAWQDGDYRGFIKHLDKIDKRKLSSSYELKYKIAYKKLITRDMGKG